MSKRDAAIRAQTAGDRERFARFVEFRDVYGCWLWTGAVDRKGYGLFSVGGRSVRAARFILWFGSGRLGEHVLHSCDTPGCVNLRHLRWGTAEENRQDMETRGRARRTGRTGWKTCRDGHEFERDKSGKRWCRTCRNTRDRNRRARRGNL